MAFDQPIEADQVDDLGLLSSLIRAPVVGIMWLLGGDEEEKKKEQEKVLLEKDSEDVDGGDEVDDCDGDDSHVDRSNGAHKHGHLDENDESDDDEPPDKNASTSVDQSASQADKENKDPSSMPNWPSVGRLESSSGEEGSKNCNINLDPNSDSAKKNASRSSPKDQSPPGESSCPSNQMIDDLANAIGSTHISNQPSASSFGPATSAVLSSQSKMTSSSTNSLSASYSASTFSNHQLPSQTLSLHSSINSGTFPSQTSTQNKSDSSIRGNKKTSWSDECGNRSLVEYFDESKAPPQSKHWSAMRRSSWRASRHSFDAGDKGSVSRRSEVRVIKSALKRSGSYSPPVALYAGSSRGANSSTSSSTDSCSSSTQQMKSFRSISVIGSSDSSRSNSSEDCQRRGSTDTDDSMAAVTNKKLHSNDMQCVIPSTLQSRYYNPRNAHSDPRYQLILGQQAMQSKGQEEKSESAAADTKVGSSPNRVNNLTSGRGSPGHHHHFLPRHTNGYVSPQYGFYVNITPPTPEMYAAKGPLKPGDKAAKSAIQQQSYQQFQYQNKYQAPSPIPEGGPGGAQGIPQRFVGRSSVPRPSSNRSPAERNQLPTARQNSLKPTFTKNKKGMGILLAENHHGSVWPTVPFG